MKKLFLFFGFCACITACDKDNANAGTCTDSAIVRWGGDPAADGLGWHIFDSVGGGKAYIPTNLPDEFKQDNLSVKVCLLETTEKFYCMCAAPLNKYRITKIKRP